MDLASPPLGRASFDVPDDLDRAITFAFCGRIGGGMFHQSGFDVWRGKCVMY